MIKLTSSSFSSYRRSRRWMMISSPTTNTDSINCSMSASLRKRNMLRKYVASSLSSFQRKQQRQQHCDTRFLVTILSIRDHDNNNSDHNYDYCYRHHTTNTTTSFSSSSTRHNIDDNNNPNNHHVTFHDDSGKEKIPIKPMTNNHNLLQSYMELSKARLSALVVCTTIAGYIAVGPEAIHMIDTAPTIMISCVVGTALCSSSAAAYNQIFEIDRDRNMKRTMYRPLITKQLSYHHAISLASLWGITGTTILYYGTDPLTALWGLGNIVLYAGLYTYLKPISIYNTWVGAIVGAIPPWMGWNAASTAVLKAKTATAAATTVVAATTAASTTWFEPDTAMITTIPNDIMASLSSSSLPPLDIMIDSNMSGLLLALTLYYWQLPHFMALSYMHRIDYQRGGFQMLPCIEMTEQQSDSADPYHRTANVMVRYTWYLSMIPWIATMTNVTSSMFALEGIVLNSYALYVAHQFRYSKTNTNARKVFITSLWYLPCTLMLFLLHSKVFHENQEEENSNKINEDTKITIGKLVSDCIHHIRHMGKELCIHEVVIAKSNNHHQVQSQKHNDDDESLTLHQTLSSATKDSCPVMIGSQKVNETTTLVVQEVIELQQQQQQEQRQQHQES